MNNTVKCTICGSMKIPCKCGVFQYMPYVAVNPDALTSAKALVGDYVLFMQKYRTAIIAEDGDLDEKARAVKLVDEKLTKAQQWLDSVGE